MSEKETGGNRKRNKRITEGKPRLRGFLICFKGRSASAAVVAVRCASAVIVVAKAEAGTVVAEEKQQDQNPAAVAAAGTVVVETKAHAGTIVAEQQKKNQNPAAVIATSTTHTSVTSTSTVCCS